MAGLQIAAVWGSEISSGGNRVGIEQAAEPRASTNSGARAGAGLAPGRIGRAEMATAMRALIVVMLTVLAENGGQMAFGDDEHPVEALSAYRSHPALRDRICLRSRCQPRTVSGFTSSPSQASFGINRRKAAITIRSPGVHFARLIWRSST